MFDFLRNYRTPMMVAVVVLLPLMVYRANVRRASRFSTLDRIVLFTTTPLNRLMANLTGSLSDAWYQYVDLTNARLESVDLRRQLTILARERDRLEFLGEENQRLRRLLELNDANPEAPAGDRNGDRGGQCADLAHSDDRCWGDRRHSSRGAGLSRPGFGRCR